LPLLIVLRVAVQRSPAVVSRELTPQLGYGAFVAPVMAFAVEAIAFVGLLAIIFGITALLPQGRDWLDKIQLLAANPAALQDQVTLGRLILSPPVMVLVLVAGIVVGPLIEEAIKVLCVAAMRYRRPVRSQALAWGIAAGAGFALTEGLLGTVMIADQWPMSVGLRMAASLLHVTTTGIVALGWFESVAARRNAWSLPLAYLSAVALHGLWNALALAATVVSAGVSAEAVPAATAAPIAAGVAALLALTFVAMLALFGGLIAWAMADEVTVMPATEQTTA